MEGFRGLNATCDTRAGGAGIVDFQIRVDGMRQSLQGDEIAPFQAEPLHGVHQELKVGVK